MKHKNEKLEKLKKRVEAAPVIELNVADLVFDAEQPRTRIEQNKIESLGASIKANGQLQNIVVRQLDGKSVIVCGERRVRGCLFIKQATIAAKSLVLTDEEVTELQLIENTQRVDMSPMDEAKAFEKHHAKKMPLGEIGERFGKTVEFIRGRLLLNRLIPELQEAVETEELSLDVAKEIATLGADTQERLIGEIFEQVPVKLLQPTADADTEDYDDEDADDYDANTDDYADGETPFDDEADADAVAEAVALPQIEYRRKSVSLGKVQKLLTEKVLVNLANAPFDIADHRLHPEGRLCEGCPNRNGSNLLFDLGSDDENICLDPVCFNNKGRKLVQITRTAYAPADGELTEARTITKNYYSHSPYRLEDTLTTHSYRKVAELGGEIDAEDQCPHTEYAVCVDYDDLAKVYVVCTNGECERHFPKYSYASEKTIKPELTAAERSRNYQESRQKGYTRNACEKARPEFFAQASKDYNGLRWIYADEDFRLLMILRFCELAVAENSEDFVFACNAVGIMACRPSYNTTAEEKEEAELLSSYWSEKERTLEEDLSRIDEDRLSKLIFALTFVKNGRNFKNTPVESDAEMQELATVLGEDYETIFAEKQVEVADKNRQPFAEKYLAELKAGIAESRPNLFTEYAVAKNGATPIIAVKSTDAKQTDAPETVENEFIENEFDENQDIESKFDEDEIEFDEDEFIEETEFEIVATGEENENTVFAQAF